MLQKSTTITAIGFAMFLVGFLAIFLSLVGMNFSFLSWINKSLGSGVAFLTNLIMAVVGLVLIYVARQSRMS